MGGNSTLQLSAAEPQAPINISSMRWQGLCLGYFGSFKVQRSEEKMQPPSLLKSAMYTSTTLASLYIPYNIIYYTRKQDISYFTSHRHKKTHEWSSRKHHLYLY